MKKFLKKHGVNLLYSATALVLMWLTWAIASLIVKNEYVVPSVENTVREALKLFSEGFFWSAVGSTFLRTVLAFLISFFIAGVLAGVGSVFKPIGRLIRPIVSVFRTLPTMALILIILLWSSPKVAPVVVAVLVLCPMMYQQFLTAIDGISDGVVSAVKVFDVSKKDRLFKIYLPMIAPSVLSHSGSNLSFGIKLIISAEVMAYTLKGLGGMMQTANTEFEIARLAGLTLIAVLLGILIEVVFHFALKHSFKWNKTEVKDD